MTQEILPVRYKTLRDRNWVRFHEAGEKWQQIAKSFDRKVDEFVRTVLDPINDESWRGEAAKAAKKKVRQTARQLAAAQTYLDANARLMQTAYDGVYTAWHRTTDSWATPPSEVAIDDDGRVSFESAPESFAWDFPPILQLMQSQSLAYQALHMADLVNRRLAPLMWFPQNRSADGVPPNSDADDHLEQVRRTCWDLLHRELPKLAKDPQSYHEDTAPQSRGDMSPEERDKATYLLLHSAADYLWLSGRTHGADLLKHWLGNTGTTKFVDPTEMREDMPKFDQEVRAVVDAAPAEGWFDHGWSNFDPNINNQPESEDWWYALNHLRFRVAGRSVIVDGSRSIHYTVGVKKAYVFGPPRDPIKIPYLGEEIPQEDIERLHHIGAAQNFIVQGLAHYSE